MNRNPTPTKAEGKRPPDRRPPTSRTARPSQDSAEPADAEAPFRFRIRFDRQRTGLSQLLNALGEVPASQQAASGPSPQAPQLSHTPRGVRRGRPWRWWPWVLTLGLVALGIGIWMGLPRDPGPYPAPPATSLGPVAPQEPALDIRQDADGWSWYPRNGESLWRLYEAQRSMAGHRSVLWTDFQAEILRANPTLTEASLVYPRQRIRFEP